MSGSFLIADDSEAKMMLLTLMLRKAKWEGTMYKAYSTDEAKKMIDDHPDIAFAFIDYYMHREFGPAVIRYLKSKNPAARIALVSSSDKQSNCEEAKAAGAETCICTTYQMDEVERRLMDILVEWRR